jgi:RNA polymerase sigma factor (sigma-70 family)
MLLEPPPPANVLETAPAVGAAELSEASDERWWTLARQLRPRLTASVDFVLRAILKRSENPGYAEDIVNDALATAYEKRGSYDPSRGRIYPWLLRIARNKAFDFLRQNKELKSEYSFDDSVVHPSQSFTRSEFLYDTAAAPNEKTLALRKALKRLRRYDQEILICRFGNALDYDELERYFNFTVKKSTLRVHVKRAQDRLRRELGKEPVFKEWLAHG